MDAPLLSLNREKTQVLPPDEQMGWTDGRWGLLVSQSPPEVTDVVLKGDELFIGRDPTSAVFISDSRRIALMFISSNGTYINGLRIQKDTPVALSHADEVSLVFPSHSKVPNSEPKPIGFTFHDLTLRKRKSSLLSAMEDMPKDLKKTLSISDILRNEMGLINRLSAAARQPAFWEVDEAALVQCHGSGVTAITEGDCYRLISLKPPHVADNSVAAVEFKKAELAFRRFVNRDRVFSVTQVDVIISPMVEERFRQKERALARSKTHGTNEEVRPWHFFANIEQTYTPQQLRAMNLLQKSIYWCVEGQSTNPVLGWHGTPEEKLPLICREGLQNLSKTDTGWFGKGVYLTQLPNYGEFYINSKRQDYGETVQLLLCWVLMGRAYPITEKREGGACQPGYDSHFALTEGFEPCPLEKEPTGDEIVAFDTAQVLPRYIVRYEISRRPHVKEKRTES